MRRPNPLFPGTTGETRTEPRSFSVSENLLTASRPTLRFMARITVLDPTAPPPDAGLDPGPDAGDLAGKTVGLRRDFTWRSFEWVVDEWAERLRGDGARVVVWVAGGRVGEEGERTARQLEEFTAGVDVALVGLGN